MLKEFRDFIAKGNVDRMPDFAERDPNNLLVQLPDGKFAEMGDKAGVASMANSRGGSVADFNLDGFVNGIDFDTGEYAFKPRSIDDLAKQVLAHPGADRFGDVLIDWLAVR